MEDLTSVCASGASYEDRMMSVADGVALRVVTFTPPVDIGNPTVLFVAGWISQITAWQTVLKEMTKDFRVVYVETREKISSRVHGNAEYSVTAIGNDLVNLVEQLGFPTERYIIFGSSLGATAIVDSYPALGRKPLALILVSPNAEFRVPRIWLFVVTLFYPPLYALIRPSVKWYLKNFRLDVRTDQEQYMKYSKALDAADPWKLKKALLSVSKYEIWDRLEFVNSPTLLVGASKDALHEPENFRKMASKIRNAVTIDLETNKRTHSEHVVRELRAFLARISTGSDIADQRIQGQ
jgi:pimeloyl-ACP methyl ester carboxylesterase